MKKLLTFLGAVGMTASSSMPIMAMEQNNNSQSLADIDISDWTFDSLVKINVQGATIEKLQEVVFGRLAEHYKTNSNYRTFFLKIATHPELFEISGNDFAIPTKDNPLNYDVMVIPNDGSGYTGITFFSIELDFATSNDIKGNVGYFEGQTIGANWSTNNKWNGENNGHRFELFNFKNYASSWGQFQLDYKSLTMNISGTQWKGWTDNDYIVPSSPVLVKFAEVDINNGFTMTLADWSDGSIEGTASVKITMSIYVDQDSGDVTVSPYIHLQVKHLGAGWRYVSGDLAFRDWWVD